MDCYVNASNLTLRIVSSLRELRNRDLAEELTLTEAADRSGYSPGHLGRLVSQGTIPNAGRLHAPRVRAVDLPKRAKNPARGKSRSYDPIADARSLRARQGKPLSGDSNT